MISQTHTLANIVLEHSECAAVLQRHHIDFCCRGGQSVAKAAEDKGLEPSALLEELSQAIANRSGDSENDRRGLSTPDLIAHIIATHHNYLREVIPFVQGLAAKVSRVHGQKNPKLLELKIAVNDLGAALIPHLEEEEQTLFPALQDSNADKVSIDAQLASMQEEHLAVADILDRVREAADGFVLPAWACMSYRTLFSELNDIEADVHIHVHLENHVLRPRFVN